MSSIGLKKFKEQSEPSDQPHGQLRLTIREWPKTDRRITPRSDDWFDLFATDTGHMDGRHF
jgi:hypothetical protein